MADMLLLVQSRYPFPRSRHFWENGVGVLPEDEDDVEEAEAALGRDRDA